MGGFGSKNFTELFNDVDIKSTPPKRVVDFDPRSPTSEVTRTPIAVEKTPCTELDPRSPTSGITRTPIYDTGLVKQADHCTAVTPITGLLFDDTADSDTEASLLLDEDSGTSVDPLIATEDFPKETDSFTVEQPIVSIDTKGTKSAIYHDPVQTEPVRRTKVKKSLRTSSLGQRSPLTPINTKQTNSPKMMIQRKQVAKLGMVPKSSSNPNMVVTKYQTATLSTGKENYLDISY